MDENYIDNLTKEQRVAWGIPIFIRLWLAGMCQSQSAQNWTISQIAVLFEVTQAHLFREQCHTATSLSKELNLSIQTVSRTVRDLQKSGLLVQKEAADDARKKYLLPAKKDFAKDMLGKIAHNFCSQWYHGWEELDKAHGAEWYFSMSQCSDSVAQARIKQFKSFAKGR